MTAVSTSITSAWIEAGSTTSAPSASPVTTTTAAKAQTSPGPEERRDGEGGAGQHHARGTRPRCLEVRRASQSQNGTPATPQTK